jgi:hypothetical protein
MRIRHLALVLTSALLAAAAGGCASDAGHQKPDAGHRKPAPNPQVELLAGSGMPPGSFPPGVPPVGRHGAPPPGSSGLPPAPLDTRGYAAGGGSGRVSGGVSGAVASEYGAMVGSVSAGSPAPALKARRKAGGSAKRASSAMDDQIPSAFEMPPLGPDETPEASARRELALLKGALKDGNLYWQNRQEMKQGKESPVKAEINLSAEPYFLRGPDAPTARARIQTSTTMTAELQGSKDDFEISPSGPQPQPLLDDRALWIWTVKPLTFGHGKRLRLLIRMQPKTSATDQASYNLPSHEADIDVAVSPAYLINTHKTLLFGTGGTGLLGLLKNKKLRNMLLRLLPGSPAAGPPADA